MQMPWPTLTDNQGVPAGSPSITVTSFTELGADESGAADRSCVVWAKAVPQAKLQASIPLINCLIIVPPRSSAFVLIDSAKINRLQYKTVKIRSADNLSVESPPPGH